MMDLCVRFDLTIFAILMPFAGSMWQYQECNCSELYVLSCHKFSAKNKNILLNTKRIVVIYTIPLLFYLNSFINCQKYSSTIKMQLTVKLFASTHDTRTKTHLVFDRTYWQGFLNVVSQPVLKIRKRHIKTVCNVMLMAY